ncbi:hypothetical protein BSKO_13239 [Bryopsis sp. KO-2023]|nr:hypothetical protein BSKO_13239 [Bryopsis sp. KO-2023]
MIIFFPRGPLLFGVWLCFLAAVVKPPGNCIGARTGGFERGQIPDYPAPSEEVVDPEAPPAAQLNQGKENEEKIKEVAKLVESYVDEKKKRFLEEWSKLVPLMVVLMGASGVLSFLFAFFLLLSCMMHAIEKWKLDPVILSTFACVISLWLVVVTLNGRYSRPEAERNLSAAESMHRSIKAIGPLAAVVDAAVVLIAVGILMDACKERCQFLGAGSLIGIFSAIIQVASLFVLEVKLKVLVEMGVE